MAKYNDFVVAKDIKQGCVYKMPPDFYGVDDDIIYVDIVSENSKYMIFKVTPVHSRKKDFSHWKHMMTKDGYGTLHIPPTKIALLSVSNQELEKKGLDKYKVEIPIVNNTGYSAGHSVVDNIVIAIGRKPTSKVCHELEQCAKYIKELESKVKEV